MFFPLLFEGNKHFEPMIKLTIWHLPKFKNSKMQKSKFQRKEKKRRGGGRGEIPPPQTKQNKTEIAGRATKGGREGIERKKKNKKKKNDAWWEKKKRNKSRIYERKTTKLCWWENYRALADLPSRIQRTLDNPTQLFCNNLHN